MKSSSPPKKITSSVAGLSLAVASPNQSQSIQQPPISIGTNMFMNVSINDIDAYENNPRRIQDADAYNDIKASIRNTGIQQPVHITKRPGESRFILAKGGNTRLQIMKELFHETQDARFHQMPCIYVDFESDRQIKIAHMIENEQRQDMCFWDKACAYQMMCIEIQADYVDKLSTRDLAQKLSNEGLQISNKTLSLFGFAYEYLTELNSMAFKLSNPKTTELRKVFHELKETYADAEFNETWPLALRDWTEIQIDTADLNVVDLSKSIRAYFATALGIPSAALTTDAGEEADFDQDCTTEAVPVTASMNVQSNRTSANNTATAVTEKSPLHSTEDFNSDATNATVETTAFVAVDPQQMQVIPVNSDQILPPKTREMVQKELHTTIRKLLKMVNLSDCFKVNEHFPIGFYMEYPAFEHLNIPQGSGIYYPVDVLHEDAGNVFAFMCHVSRQELLMNDYELGAANPFLTLPNHSKARIAYEDDEKRDEFNVSGIGERSNLIIKLLEWQTQNHPLSDVVENVISRLKALNTL